MKSRQANSRLSIHRRPALIAGHGGFTLVESMVALTVLSIGLFGIAGMLDMAISRNADGSQVSIATNLAAEMVDRIRYNRFNATAYNGIDSANTGTRPPAIQPMAMGDYDQWRARLNATGLANVRGLVTVGASGPAALNQSQIIVQVVWRGGIRSQSMVVSTMVTPE